MESLMVNVIAFVAGVKNGLTERLTSEKGATAVEYGMLVALIAAVIVTVVVALGGQIKTAFTTISTAL
jgi:pilus assembly protein Flp/PilA